MLRRSHASRRPASILPLVAICITAMVGFMALAVDVGVIAATRTQCQNAADAAAMAGARTLTGDSSTTYNVASVPGQAITTAVANQILGQPIQGSSSSVTTVNGYTYQSGQVTVQVGAYAYVYNDTDVSTEGFQLLIPNTVSNEPYSACQVTIGAVSPVSTSSGNVGSPVAVSVPRFFGTVWGLSGFNTGATAVAIHRPRDVAIVLDLSGSMHYNSLAGVGTTTVNSFGTSGTFSLPFSDFTARTRSMNPDTLFPQFGHYSDQTTAALQGTTSIECYTGEMCDPCNLTTTQNGSPPVVQDFYSNAVGSNPSSSNVAFSASTASSTTPNGDIPVKTSLGTTSTYAQTLTAFNSNSTNTNVTWETQGYTGNYSAQMNRPTFYGYTEGPGYWGKTFFIWPPAPPGSSVTAPPSSISSTTFNWYNNGSKDWRQRFFVAVNTSSGAPAWIQHNTILFRAPASASTQGVLNLPNSDTATVTEGGSSVTYKYYINYAAILYWLSQNPVEFPSTLTGGRIRYYSSMPSGTDNALNNRWWTTTPASLPNNERFWKEYIDFVLGFYATGTNTYTQFQSTANVYGSGTGFPAVLISSLIGNGDWYQWSGSSLQISTRSRAPAASNPTGPYQSGTMHATASSNTSALVVDSLSSAPVANKDYVTIGAATTPYLITAATLSSGRYTLTISPALSGAASINSAVKVYSPYMDYNDCPYRPRHHLWFGAMTFVDWLGNYNFNSSLATPHLMWPGNVHEAHSWACKAGVQTAIQDMKNNHPNDFVSLMFFSNPLNSRTDTTGFHNTAVVALGRNYQHLIDSLWFPPRTVTGGASEITPFDADFSQVPRANGSTAPQMGFMLAYNQLSSSVTNLRFYSQPSAAMFPTASTSNPNYRGLAGGLGRKGAQRIVIFETDGFPNTRAYAALAGSGSDSYYQIRVYNPASMSNSNNVEFPDSSSAYVASEVYSVVQQICAQDSASPPGFSTSRKPALVHCIGYGSIFDPTNSGSAQTSAMGFLQTVQYYGGTSPDTTAANFPSYKCIYGSASNRVSNMQKAFTTIMQTGVQVSLIQ